VRGSRRLDAQVGGVYTIVFFGGLSGAIERRSNVGSSFVARRRSACR
jgi:hypothetical protein